MIRKRRFQGLLLAFGFILGSYNGYIALWRDTGPDPIRVFPYSVSSLPQSDQQALERGIELHSREELLRLLEDYLS